MAFKIQELFFAKSHILLSYLLCAVLGYYWGCRQVSREKIEVIKPDMSVKLQGSWRTLILLIGFFFIKYLFGFMNSEMPELAYEYRGVELGISGIFTWYFLGRAVGYWMRYKKV